MTIEEKSERNRATSQSKKEKKLANKAKAAGSGAEAPPPPAAHPQKRDAKPARNYKLITQSLNFVGISRATTTVVGSATIILILKGM